MPRAGNRLGDILIDIGKLSETELTKALAIQKAEEVERRLGEILIEQGCITEEDLQQALHLQRTRMWEKKVPQVPQVTAHKPVNQIVASIINEALEREVSDIHIEPFPDRLRVRYRIDGVLHEMAQLPMDIHKELVARVRVMADLDIIQRGIPQDGSIVLDKHEFRVSIFPFIYGDKIVLRVLNPPATLAIEELGLQGRALDQYQQLIRRPSGLILATGPTGSGKTTTLTASLKTINSPQINISTVEDPPEYRIENINQTQVNPRKGIDFASALRYLFRQDPDVIMIGEIRDEETAQMATRAALTGHLVFSTLHSNSAVGTVPRLLNMGAEPYLLAATLRGVIAQRLVRKLCGSCKQQAQLEKWEQKIFEIHLRGAAESVKTIYRPIGCTQCSNRGYRGRTGIFELLVVNERIRDMIAERASDEKIIQEAINSGMTTLIGDGLRKVIGGITSMEEVLWHMGQ
ncbi:MAG: ATPase, T2SS/T4P/T4SS family [Candidatus Bipolaricaulia bacterium]